MSAAPRRLPLHPSSLFHSRPQASEARDHFKKAAAMKKAAAAMKKATAENPADEVNSGEELDEKEAAEEEQIAEAEAEVALAAGPPLPKRPVVCPGASPDRLQRSSKRSAKDGRGRWSAAFAVKRGCGDPRQCASFIFISP